MHAFGNPEPLDQSKNVSTGLSYGFLNSPIYLEPWILLAQSDASTPRHKRGPGNPEWCPIPGRSISAIPRPYTNPDQPGCQHAANGGDDGGLR